MKLYTKPELIEKIRNIFMEGWHQSVKTTVDTRNDGAVGNTLESLLGIKENNLPIPNAREWELKGQRLESKALITLKHIEPSPRAARIVPEILLPLYGWKHKEAGLKYGFGEMSFRSTTSALGYTNRGFIIKVDRIAKKFIFDFNYEMVDNNDSEISTWLGTVKERVGLGKIQPEPYWGFDDIQPVVATKMKNCFYAKADRRIIENHEWFLYKELYTLSGFSFDNFLTAIESGDVYIEFDARTHHNHGTKFRLKQNCWQKLYSDIQKVL